MPTHDVLVRVQHIPYPTVPPGGLITIDNKETIISAEIEGNKKAVYLVIVKDPA